jgi:hypothetical protein
LKTIFAFLDRGTVRNTLVFSWTVENTQEICTITLFWAREQAHFESLELASWITMVCMPQLFFFCSPKIRKLVLWCDALLQVISDDGFAAW